MLLPLGKRAVFIASLVLLGACSSAAPYGGSAALTPSAKRHLSSSGPTEFAVDRLRQRGLSDGFVDLVLNQYHEDERTKVLDLNLIGFLKTHPPLDERVPRWEVEKVRKFLNKNHSAFADAERRFKVPKEVIAALLWTETKFGKDAGTFHVASSFFSLVQADYPTILDQTLDHARELAGTLKAEASNKISDRSKSRAEWAVSELVALQEMHQKGYANARKLRGSFSGAFGIAQFVPSSYLSWAKSEKGGTPDLFHADDAILSVGSYLHAQGWDSEEIPTQMAALYHYNHDVHYGNRILRMGGCLKTSKKRSVASHSLFC